MSTSQHFTYVIVLQGEMAAARLYLPETNTSRHLVLAIANSLKVMDRHGNVSSVDQKDEKWSRVCSKRCAICHCCPDTQ